MQGLADSAGACQLGLEVDVYKRQAMHSAVETAAVADADHMINRCV